MNLLGKIVETIKANFSFLNRVNSPSVRNSASRSNVGLLQQTSAPIQNIFQSPSNLEGLTEKRKAVAQDLRKRLVNRKHEMFDLKNGKGRLTPLLISKRLQLTKRFFESNSLYFDKDIKDAFTRLYYHGFDSAFSGQDLHELNRHMNDFEDLIRAIINHNADKNLTDQGFHDV